MPIDTRIDTVSSAIHLHILPQANRPVGVRCPCIRRGTAEATDISMNDFVLYILNIVSFVGGNTVKVGPLSRWDSSLGRWIRGLVESVAVTFSRLPIFGRLVSTVVELTAQTIAFLAQLPGTILTLVGFKSAASTDQKLK